MIRETALQVIIPDIELSTEQYMAMYNTYMYGQSAGVDVEWTVTR
jgi:hypothetical protein